MTTEKWEELLEASVASHGETYLHLHHLGVIAAERLNIPLATARLRRSIALRPTAVAHRNLAALLTDPVEMAEHFMAAWALALGNGQYLQMIVKVSSFKSSSFISQCGL